MAQLMPSLTATWTQAAAYLIGVCLFSISFLVFLNASSSFAVTDIIGQRQHVGDVVGTLSFADELLGLAACPLWGILADRIGLRAVSMLGLLIIALSFVVVPSSRTVYPGLLLVRLLFSIGAAACTTMISAILPTMNFHGHVTNDAVAKSFAALNDEPRPAPMSQHPADTLDTPGNRDSLASFSSELTITPARYGSFGNSQETSPSNDAPDPPHDADLVSTRESSKLAGLVGMSTGLGALLAVVAFLPLPALYGHGHGTSKAVALSQTYYTVAAIAFVVSGLVWFGLAGLPGDRVVSPAESSAHRSERQSIFIRVRLAIRLVIADRDLSLACVGGFVARAASTGISLFVPLYVNAYFIRRGLCTEEPGELLKEQCRRAYTLSSMLTGVSQLIALLSAPFFGYLGSHFASHNTWNHLPIGISALSGSIGSLLFGLLDNPDPFADRRGHSRSLLSIPAVTLIGIGQIGAIVCSLSFLSRGIQRAESAQSRRLEDTTTYESNEARSESTSAQQPGSQPIVATISHRQVKGTVAGIYSLCGGAGIILLSKLGGILFDKVSTGGPFFMLAGFNGLLMVAVAGATLVGQRRVRLVENE